jgi:hypothetical protein
MRGRSGRAGSRIEGRHYTGWDMSICLTCTASTSSYWARAHLALATDDVTLVGRKGISSGSTQTGDPNGLFLSVLVGP